MNNEFAIERVGRSHSKVRFVLRAGDDTSVPGQVNPFDPDDVDARVDELCEQFAALGQDDCRQALRQLALPSDSPNPPTGGESQYTADPSAIYQHRPTPNGIARVRLTNFTARIAAEVTRDDGGEQTKVFEVVANMSGREYRIAVSPEKFVAMNWPIEQMGAKAIVYPGVAARDHARTAIQQFSTDVQQRTVYTHTGWRDVGGQWVYLHAGGAIGTDGPVAGVEVELPPALANYRLPDPPDGETLRDAVRASLRVMALGGDETRAAYCTVWRSVLGSVDAAHHLFGGSGRFKSELAALLVQHFGPAMDRTHLPAAWSSTDNALEELSYLAKDALLVVDEFKPAGTPQAVAQMHQRAERVLRAQGNGSGRARMNRDGSLRAQRPPRGMILSTGEDIPRGHSLQARMMRNEVGHGAIPVAKLTECQRDARDGLTAGAMAGYVRWLSCRVCRVWGVLHNRVARLRRIILTDSSHRRTPEVVAQHAIGLWYFLRFARECGVVGRFEARRIWRECYGALVSVADREATSQAAQDPGRRFFTLLNSAIASGKAHLARRKDGLQPEDAQAFGWRQIQTGVTSNWQPWGSRVGWVDDDGIYLDPDSAYKAAQDAAAAGEGLDVTAGMIWRRLGETGGPLMRESSRPDELKSRHTCESKQQKVIHLKLDSLSLYEIEPDKPDKSYKKPEFSGQNQCRVASPAPARPPDKPDSVDPTPDNPNPPNPAEPDQNPAAIDDAVSAGEWISDEDIYALEADADAIISGAAA